MEKFDWKHIEYKDGLSPTKLLVTNSCSGKYPTQETYANDMEIYKTNIWIHNGVIEKYHCNIEGFKTGDEVTLEQIVKLIRIKDEVHED